MMQNYCYSVCNFLLKRPSLVGHKLQLMCFFRLKRHISYILAADSNFCTTGLFLKYFLVKVLSELSLALICIQSLQNLYESFPGNSFVSQFYSDTRDHSANKRGRYKTRLALFLRFPSPCRFGLLHMYIFDIDVTAYRFQSFLFSSKFVQANIVFILIGTGLLSDKKDQEQKTDQAPLGIFDNQK